MTGAKRIALLGTGLIGGPMAKRLMQSGYPLTVYNRTISKTDSLKNGGATVAQTPKAAIESAECTILVLSDAGAINDTLFSTDSKIDFANRTIIQMGTILTEESVAFKNKISAAGGQYFESPVLGSIPQATEGKLIVMVGATPGQFERWKNLLKCFGEEVRYLGEVGKAAALKLALNQLIASLTAAFSLSLGIVQRSEIDVETFMAILRKSALYAPTFDKKLQRMLKRDFSDPNFPTKHLLKDMSLIQSESKKLGLSTQVVSGIIDLIKISLEKGFAETDYSAIYNAVNPSS
jgi:3-hydroxyisobutyrate dehydrogenase